MYTHMGDILILALDGTTTVQWKFTRDRLELHKTADKDTPAKGDIAIILSHNNIRKIFYQCLENKFVKEQPVKKHHNLAPSLPVLILESQRLHDYTWNFYRRTRIFYLQT